MATIDNTRFIKGMQSEQPMAYLRSKGLAGLAITARMEQKRMAGLADGTGDPSWNFDMDTVGKAITAFNSEALYLMNLQRINSGQQPISQQYAAPQVQVGVSPDTQKLLVGAGIIGIAGLLLLSKRRR